MRDYSFRKPWILQVIHFFKNLCIKLRGKNETLKRVRHNQNALRVDTNAVINDTEAADADPDGNEKNPIQNAGEKVFWRMHLTIALGILYTVAVFGVDLIGNFGRFVADSYILVVRMIANSATRCVMRDVAGCTYSSCHLPHHFTIGLK